MSVAASSSRPSLAASRIPERIWTVIRADAALETMPR